MIYRELFNKRTETAKHYKIIGTNAIKAVESSAPCHYRESGGWHDVQKTAIRAIPHWGSSERLQLVGNKLKVRFGDNPDTDYQELVEFARLINTEQGNQEYYFTLALKDLPVTGSVENWKQPTPGDWQFQYDGLLEGADLKVLCNTKGRASWQLHISSEEALDALLDSQNRINLSMYLGEGLTFDDFTLKNSSGQGVFYLNQPYVILKDGDNIALQDHSLIEMTSSTELVGDKTFTILHKRLTDVDAIRNHIKAGKTVIIDPSVTLQPGASTAKDAEMRNQNPDLNLGTSIAMYAGRYDADNLYKPIIAFPGLTSYSNITATTLKFAQKSQLSSTYDHDFDLTVYRVLCNWTESGVTWNKYDGTNSWTTAGCGSSGNDYHGTALGTMYNVNGNNPIYTWYSASLDATEVGKMADGTYNNYGFVLPYEGTSDSRHAHFLSSDSTNSTYHPKLEITYTTTTAYEAWEGSADMSLYVGTSDAKVSVNPVSGTQNGSIDLNITVTDKQKTNTEVRVELSYQEGDSGGYISLTGVESGNNFLSFNSFTGYTQSKTYSFDSISTLTNGSRYYGDVYFRAKITYDNGSTVAGDSSTISFSVNNMIQMKLLPAEQVINSTDTYYCNMEVESLNRSSGQTYKIEITELKIGGSAQSGFPKDTVSNASSFEVYYSGSWVAWDQSKLATGTKIRYKHSGGVTNNSKNDATYTVKAYEIT